MAKPLLFLTGFLGSGKTTLLRNLLIELGNLGKKADVILNDFANAELDAATLDQSTMASIAPIAASCACCDSLDELMALCGAAARGEGDLLLIELNGTADPVALLEAFTLLEDRLPFFPRLQACIIDARHWEQRGEFSPLERRQLETAGLWVLSHGDAVGETRRDEVIEGIPAVAPHTCRVTPWQLAATLVEEIESEPPPESRLAVSRFRLVTQASDDPAPLLQMAPKTSDPVHRLSHRFTGCQVALPPRLRRQVIEDLLADLPDWVVRAKALVKLTDAPGCRWLFQKSGADPLPPPIPVPEIQRVSPSLVCVGPRLDPEIIRSLVRERLGWQPSPASGA